MQVIARLLPLAVVSGGLILSACSSTEVGAPGEMNVALSFTAMVADEAFVCGDTYIDIGIGLSDWQVSDFRFFIHEAHLHDEATDTTYSIALTQDLVWQHEDVALIDMENGCGAGTPEMNQQVVGTITLPAGVALSEHVEACFVLGVPEHLNHLDPASAPAPLNASGMLWAWKSGMKFVRVDGTGDPAGTPQAYNLHLGAQNCPGASSTAPPDAACATPNTVEICIEDFDINHDVIAVDPGAVLVASDVTNNYSGAPGCQSSLDDQDCIAAMPRLGLDFIFDDGAGTIVTVGAEQQQLFRKQ
jgi:uncharacterized repeat protein (TIGR04052 family)